MSLRGVLRGGCVFAVAALCGTLVITAEPQRPADLGELFPQLRGQAPAAGTASVSPVTDAMLAKPPAQDWLMWRGTLDSWGYSPLTQITRDNVNQLQLVWTRVLEFGRQEVSTLVNV
jgi:hypothetical protein